MFGVKNILASAGNQNNKGDALYVWGEDGTVTLSGFFRYGVGRLGFKDDILTSAEARTSSPVFVAAPKWVSVDATPFHSVAIKSDGSLYSWGDNYLGALGNSYNRELQYYYNFTKVFDSVSWSKISASSGGRFTLAIKPDGSLWAWGFGQSGQLGDGLAINHSSPIKIGSSSWSAISAGYFHALAIRSDGALFGWGDGSSGQIGNNEEYFGDIISPIQIGTSSWIKISAGEYDSYAIRSDNTLFGWGTDIFRLKNLSYPDNTITSRSSPVQVSSELLFKEVDAASQNIMALSLDDKLYVWGYGNYLFDVIASPIQIGTSSWSSVSSGHIDDEGLTFAIRSDGALFAWGSNNGGAFGNGESDYWGAHSPIQIGTSSWIKVSAGETHAAAIRSDGALFTWGRNTFGVLGDGTTVWKSSPIQIGTSSWSTVSSGGNFTAAIRSDGTLFTWGINNNGVLGNFADTNRFSPIKIGTSSWTFLSTSTSHNMAIRSDGGLFAWGGNQYGQLGDGTTSNRSSPTQIGTSSWSNVSSAEFYTSAIRSDGALFVWGRNNLGQLGDGTTTTISSPIQIGTSSWSKVATGITHAAAIRTDGGLFTWGSNNLGQLADGTTVSKSSPTQVGTSSWTSLDAGDNHTAAIRTDGGLFTWGLGNSGQLGENKIVSRSSPIQVGGILIPGGASSTTANVTSITNTLLGSSGLSTLQSGSVDDAFVTINLPFSVTFFGTSYSTIYIGSNSYITYGNGSSQYSGLGAGTPALPKIMIGAADNSYQQVFGGVSGTTPNRTYRVRFEGTASTSGTVGAPNIVWEATYFENDSTKIELQIGAHARTSGFYGVCTATTKIGDLTTTSNAGYNITTQFADGSDTLGGNFYSYTAVSAASNTTFGVTNTGALFAWGLNTGGRFGDGTTVSKSSPVQIGTSSWTSVSAGVSYTTAVKNGGSLFAWGLNSSGQFGDGTTTSKSSPVQIGTSSWNNVSAAGSHTVAILSDGSLFTWGSNSLGLLGANTAPSVGLVNISEPVQIGFDFWTSVDLGVNHAVAIRSDGALFAWGNNTSGQLGDGTTVSKSAPVQIGTSSWASIGVGDSTTLAVRSDGALFAWGLNARGLIGDGTTVSKSSPIQIGTSSWSTVDAHVSHCIGIRSDGALFTWGYNPYGELGTGLDFKLYSSVVTSRSSPVQIGSSSWSKISAGIWRSFAINSENKLFGWGNNLTVGGIGAGIDPLFPNKYGDDSWTQIATRYLGSMALKADNTLWLWGRNQWGELGNGIRDADGGRYLSPIQVSIPDSNLGFKKISLGDYRSAVLRNDGVMFSWGDGVSGEFGDGTSDFRSSPAQIGGTFNDIELGVQHTTALNNNDELLGAGENAAAGLGYYGFTFIPNKIGTSSWTSVSAAEGINLAIRSDGGLFAWGQNIFGNLGNGNTIKNSSPIQIGTSSWSKISVGISSSFAIKNDGALFGWGSGGGGMLPNIIYDSPILLGTSSWTFVTNSGGSNFAIRSDGGLFTWGSNNYGQLGNGTTLNRSSPVQVGTSSWISVHATGSASAYAIRSDGALFAWGRNDFYGQLGDNTRISKSSPVQIGTSSWSTLPSNANDMGWSLGNWMAAIRSDGGLFTWGYGGGVGASTLGDGTTVSRSSPVQIGTSSWTKIAVSLQLGAAIRSDGGLFIWSSTTSPAVLLRSNPNNISSPVLIGTNSWSIIGNGDDFSVALRSDGALFVWGDNRVGQIGDGTTVSKSSPVQIGTSSWIKVSSGTSHAVAIRSDGALFVWGLNFYGQLGDNTSAPKSSPIQIGTSSWIAVAADGSFGTYAIRSDGALFAWGICNNGEIGDGTTVSKSSPVKIGTSSWTFVSVRKAIRSDGALFVWGRNVDSGQLGDGTTESRSSPVQIGTSSWTSVSSLGGSTRAITLNGALYAWGFNGDGALGDGTTIDRSSPVQIGTSSWAFVSIGTSQTLAIRSDGVLFGWGKNLNYILTDITDFAISSPVQIGTSSWTSVKAGYSHVSGIRSDGALLTWGNNDYGQLGSGVGPDVSWNFSPVQIGTSSWTSVSTFYKTSHAIRSDGALFGWGLNDGGRIGDGTTVYRSSPVQIGTSSWTYVSSGDSRNENGYFASSAIRSDGAMFTWGSNSIVGNNSGLLGDFVLQRALQRSSPVQIGTSSWSIVGIHFNGTAIRSDGALFTWGDNYLGALGIGKQADTLMQNRSSPTQIGSVTVSWSLVSSSLFHALAIDTAGRLYAWGSGDFGALGDGSTISRSDPVQVGTSSWNKVAAGASISAGINSQGKLFTWGLTSNYGINTSSPVQIRGYSWNSVASGDYQNFAIRSDGALFAWGLNQYGELGDGTTIYRSSPVQIGTDSWSKISTRVTHVAAIRSDGALFTWGDNVWGQLGDGTTVRKSSPVQIGTSSWISVVATWRRTVALRSDSIGFAWGYNFDGPLGDGTEINRSSPVQIGTSSWSVLEAGHTHTVAIRTDGALFAWGTNQFGQLGDGTTISKSSPVQIDDSSWIAVAGGSESTFAIRSDNMLFGWGASGWGELGDGTTISKSSPIQIGSSSWTAVYAGTVATAAIRSDNKLFTWGRNDGGRIGNGGNLNVSSPVQIGTQNWNNVSVGLSFMTGISSDYGLQTWGNLNNNLYRRPMYISNPYLETVSWTQVATAKPTTSSGAVVPTTILAIDENEKLFIWGNRGQLFGTQNSAANNAIYPQEVKFGSWSAVAAGYMHVLGITD